ncbi:tail fiber domain-containing protein [Parapedobacter deserti]|uniref:Tail fiber domain-containing protein n=1 Tax=Parapedobacter deserti TaxID=1912957 RepID=A0ABV7JRW8_9SPHI
MKMKLLCALLLAGITTVHAQTGIGTTTPNSDASLELGATDKGFLPNRVALTNTAVWGLTNGTAAHGMVVYNTNAGIVGTLAYPATGTGLYYWDGNGWVPANNPGDPDYDWLKAGNLFPTAAGDNSTDIYHIGGRVGIGTANPVNTMHVVATADESTTVANNIVARFDPLGGQNFDKAAAIIVNGGRAVFGYDRDSTGGKYAFLRGNNAADIRLQVIDPTAVLHPKSLFISGNHSPGFVGINTDRPQSQLDIRGTTRILAGTGTQTGTMWHGTSNYNGFEVMTLDNGDAFASIQRSGIGGSLYLTKPAGTVANSAFMAFMVGGAHVGIVQYNGSGVTYQTTSDVRLKENIRVSQYGLSTVSQMKVYDYNFKASKEKTISTGLIAQELYELYPQAVSVGGEDAKANPWMVDYSKLSPVLIKAVQELNKKIETMEQALQEKNRQIAELQATVESVAQLTEEVNKIKQAVSK